MANEQYDSSSDVNKKNVVCNVITTLTSKINVDSKLKWVCNLVEKS